MEKTTTLFAEVQVAYEVLSDPQERAWYDSHRDAILHGESEEHAEHYEHNIRVTTAEDILKIFSRANGRMDFSDSPSGFYTTLRSTFDTLAKEEEIACEWENLDSILYPSFGSAQDNYEDVVKPFYVVWSGFATKKTFAWKDVYRYSEAPDRRVRRMMEKENKRFRDEGIREFNDAVRSLVAFVRKRDPRYKSNAQSEAERQKTLKEAAAAQASRSRAANQAKIGEYVVPEWSKTREPDEDVNEDGEDEDAEKVETAEHFECVVCNKTFKSEKQYEAHEKSKKHTKAVQQLRREMQKDDKQFDLRASANSALASPTEAYSEDENASDLTDQVEQPLSKDSGRGDLHDSGNEKPKPENSVGEEIVKDSTATADEHSNSTADDSSLTSSDDEYAPRARVEERILGQDTHFTPTSELQPDSTVNDLARTFAAESLDQKPESNPVLKLGKAKEKRAKKAAQNAAVGSGLQPGVSFHMLTHLT